MIADGWEVGSHSETHVDLTQNPDVVSHEELQSRLDLEEATGAPVMTFAYPFGLTNDYVTRMAQESGYVAAVGLGTSVRHTWNTLYYLSRREVQGNYILKQFVGLLTAPASLEAATPAAP
jgi:peptidoglycan/xylan/chitin deacetylase (PgdA/CDA1 family)